MVAYSFDTEKLVQICRNNDVSMVGVFGSSSRGEETGQSDIDLLVEFSVPKGLLALGRLEYELSEALNRKVDLLTEGALSPYLREHVLGELQIIYES